MSKISTVMALYKLGLMTDKEVVDWADEQLIQETESFDHISLLSLKGPGHCLKLASSDFPGPREFSFREEFALRTKSLDLKSKSHRKNFVEWLSSECMDQDIEVPEVHFAYLIDHYFFECDDMVYANKFLEEQLSIFAPQNEALADEILASIA